MRGIAYIIILAACGNRLPAPAWHDEFDGPAGATFDRTKWIPDVGGDGNGNYERQFYTERANAALDGKGHLVITARAESDGLQCWYGPCRYTSARIKTKGLFA